MTIYLTGDADADALLAADDLALLIGMLLDQQIPMETAFAGPAKIRDRIGSLDAATIADFDPDAFAEIFKQPPAVHRFPGSMAARVQAVCAAVRDDWHGDASAIWTSGDPDGAEVLRRLRTLPGYAERIMQVFSCWLEHSFEK